jgi:hypothetical protein
LPATRISPRDRLLAKAVVDLDGPRTVDDAPCWNWRGARNKKGYGRFGYQGRTAYPHRLMYIWTYGVIPDGLEIDHLCRNASCVNPAHLEAVTGQVNMLRAPTIAKANADKTHCPAGHEYTVANTYISKRNQRYCRKCSAAYQRELRRRRREETSSQ